LTTSYPETRLSSACGCITAPVITEIVTDYVVALATTDSSTSSDPVTTTSDVTSTSTDDASTTSDTASTSTESSTSADTTSTTSSDSSTVTSDTTSTTSSDSSTITDATTTTSSDVTSATSETTSSTSPAITTTGNQGCWVEPLEGHALPIKYDSVDMTVEKCDTLCADYTYYGLEYGRECYCGNAFEHKPFRTEPEACDIKCLGDLTQSCGGRSLFNLYQRNAADQTTAPADGPAAVYQPMGCFAEPQGAKALSQVYSSPNMTHALCFSHCHAGGYAYAGLEYGQECWCGNTITAGTGTADGQCTAPCAGAPDTETCGNGNVIELFSAPL